MNKRLTIRIALAGALSASLFLPCGVLADDSPPQVERWRFTTFGTLGISHTQGDDFAARRDLSQPNSFNGDWSWKLDSLVGGQLNAELTDTVSLLVQGVFKSRPEQSLDRTIERASLGWQATPNLSFHAGRLGLDFYMLSDYRDVGFAYLWMRPPTEFYGPVYVQGLDGLDAVYRHSVGSGSVVARLFAGSNERDLLADGTDTANTVNLKPAWGGSLTFENEHWRLKIGGTRVRIDSPLDASKPLLDALNNPALQALWPAAAGYADTLDVQGKTFSYYSLGASYDGIDWQVSGEFGYFTSEWAPVSNTSSAYASIGRHFGPVTPYVLFSMVRPAHDVRIIEPPPSTSIPALDAQLLLLSGGVQSAFQSVRFEQNTLSVGARWDVHPNIALKLQWDHSEIDASGSSLWWNRTGTTPSPAASVDLVSASLNWMY